MIGIVIIYSMTAHAVYHQYNQHQDSKNPFLGFYIGKNSTKSSQYFNGNSRIERDNYVYLLTTRLLVAHMKIWQEIEISLSQMITF